LKVFFSITTNEQWKITALDVTNGFIQGKKIGRGVYIEQLEEIKKDSRIWNLKRVTYGLGDAPCNWYFTVESGLIKLGGNKIKELMVSDHGL